MKPWKARGAADRRKRDGPHFGVEVNTGERRPCNAHILRPQGRHEAGSLRRGAGSCSYAGTCFGAEPKEPYQAMNR